MKKILFLLISMLVLIPTLASAHTELTASTPAANQVVKDDVKEIVLAFGGKIESLSTMTLVKDGGVESPVTVTPEENKLTGTLPAPLENGSYIIKWRIAGEDGHPISGEIPFTVQKEVKEEQLSDETKQPVAPKKEEIKKETIQQESNDSNSTIKTSIVVAVVIIFIIGVFLLFRRKR